MAHAVPKGWTANHAAPLSALQLLLLKVFFESPRVEVDGVEEDTHTFHCGRDATLFLLAKWTANFFVGAKDAAVH